MRDSLRAKLMVAFIGLALGPLCLAGLGLLAAGFGVQERQTLSTQRLAARGIAADFSHYMDHVQTVLEQPARQTGLTRLGADEQHDLANALLAFEPMLVDVSVLGPTGRIQARASRYQAKAAESAPKSLAGLPEVAAALTSKAPALGQVRYDEDANEPVVGFVVPAIAPASGEIEGLLAANVRFRRVWAMTSPQAALPDLTAYVVDSQGRVVAHRNPSVVLSGATVLPVAGDGWGKGMNGEAAFMVSEPVVVAGRRFLVVVEQPMAAAMAMPLRILGVVGLVLAFAGIAAALIVRQSRQAILAPLLELGSAARGIEGGDLGRRAAVTADDEIGDLARAFNAMGSRVESLLTDLGQSEEKFRLVAESASDAMVVIDDKGLISSWNRGALTMFGYEASEALGQSLTLLMPAPMRSRHEAILAGLRASGGRSVNGDPREQPAQRKDGTVFPVEVTLAAFDFRGRRFYSGIIRDITARKEAESNIRFLAQHDSLTGLANRPALGEKLFDALATVSDDSKVCLLFIDLDNFKYVNDVLGHSFGDKLLRMVAERLVTIEGGQNTVCRHGGDEFILLAPGTKGVADAEELARRVLAIMSEPFAIEGQGVEVGCSIGISVAPDDGLEPGELIRKADIAMYRAKERGRLGYQIFTAAMDEQLLDRRRLEDKLRRGLKRGEITAFLQPKFAFSGGALVGFEALARWNSPDLGQVPPSRFIPVAEEAGLIGAIGETILRQTLATLRDWIDRGLEAAPVAVNLSVAQLRNPSLIGDIEALLREYEVAPGLLELELTESMLMGDVEEVRATLARLRALGIKLSIDDFGTGYSSLSYLKRFPLNVLKIDRSFVCELPHDREDVAICLAIINMAKALSLDVVAEGVETDEQAKFLRDNGCDFAQGYLYGKPDTVDQAERHLTEAMRARQAPATD